MDNIDVAAKERLDDPVTEQNTNEELNNTQLDEINAVSEEYEENKEPLLIAKELKSTIDQNKDEESPIINTKSGNNLNLDEEVVTTNDDQIEVKNEDKEDYTYPVSISVSTTLINSPPSNPNAAFKFNNNINQSIQVASKKTIFICYCPEASFTERKIVSDTVQELKLNGMSESIWFDKTEAVIDTCCWMAQCSEMAEKCRAALLFVSEGFFSCDQSLLQSRILLERLTDPNAVGQLCVYTAIVSPIDLKQIPKKYHPLFERYIDLQADSVGPSIAERVSAIVGVFSIDLEYYAESLQPPGILGDDDPARGGGPPGRYRRSRILTWTTSDVQEWLQSLAIREFYRQSFAEWMLDGFLLVAMTERDMTDLLEVDSRVVRKKLTSQIVAVMEKEHKQEENWHLRCRSMRSKPNSVYLIFDPADARLAQTLTHDLAAKGLIVRHHGKLGQSREEFLATCGPGLAQAKHVLALVTEHSSQSPFFLQQVMFSKWLGKPILAGLFMNVWHKFGYLLKGTLGDCSSIDFATQLYEESMSILENVVRPIKTIPGLILEQAYLTKVTEGVRPLREIINASVPASLTSLSMKIPSKASLGGGGMRKSSTFPDQPGEPSIFISFQWDMAGRAKEIKRFLEHNGFACWTDIDHERIVSGRSTTLNAKASSADSETLQGYIQRSMKAAQLVICCVTPKYVQSDNCLKDLTLADLLRKPIVPLMLRFCPWPPEGTPPPIKRILHRLAYVDLSNPKFNKQNMALLLDRVCKTIGSPAS